MKKLIALKSLTYNTRRLLAGDEFMARPTDARLLIAIRKASDPNVRVTGSVPPPPKELLKKVAATTPPASGDSGVPATELQELRTAYQTALGKKPFNGWDADTLRQKIEAASTEE